MQLGQTESVLQNPKSAVKSGQESLGQRWSNLVETESQHPIKDAS